MPSSWRHAAMGCGAYEWWNNVGECGAPRLARKASTGSLWLTAPSNPAVAYAWGAQGATAYLWRRAGGTWTAVTAPPGVSTGQAWYDWCVEQGT